MPAFLFTRDANITKVFRAIVFLFLAAIVFASCSTAKNSFNPAHKFAPEQLREDLSILKTTLDANHPSLYWYTTKDSLEGYYAATFNSIHDSLTEQQFRNKVAWWVSKIHCGHTSTRFSEKYIKYYEKKKLPQFPLNLKVWKDSAVVINNLLKNESVLKRGDIILSINHISSRKIIDSMCAFISTDGYSDNFKYQAISFNFPAYYRNAFGLDSQYVVSYIDSSGKKLSRTIRNYEPVADTGKKAPPVGEQLSKRNLKKLSLAALRAMIIDTTNCMATLEINTFSKGKLRRFFRQSFRTIQEQHIKNVVVDLRRNTGGSVNASTRLSQYMTDHSFRVADTVAALRKSIKNKEYIHPWFFYWFSLNIAGRKRSDGRIHYPYFEHHVFKPKKRNHFGGNIYVLTGGFTFSASTLVLNNLKGQRNVTLVGEETGGGSYGNTAIHIPDIVLPNSRVRVRLPLFRVVLNAEKVKNGRGVMPDVAVPPSANYLRKGIDAKLEKVQELIKSQRG